MREKGLGVMLRAAVATSLLAECGGGGKPTEIITAPATAETAAAAADTTATSEKPEAETEAEIKDGATSDDLIVVGYAQVGAEPDWKTASMESFRSTFTEGNGYKLIFGNAQQKRENQIKAIRSFIQQDVDYIVVAPVAEAGWGAVLRETQEAGIPITLSNRQMDVGESLHECWVGGSSTKRSEAAGNWLTDYLKVQGRNGENINTVTPQGIIGTSAQIGHTEGPGNILKQHDSWRMLDMRTGEFIQAKGQEAMESFLKSYDDIDMVITENDNMVFGAIDTVKAAGRTYGPDGDITTFSFGAAKVAFDIIIVGDLNAAFRCNPLHGLRVDETIKKLEKGEAVKKIQYADETYFDTSTDLGSIRAKRAYQSTFS